MRLIVLCYLFIGFSLEFKVCVWGKGEGMGKICGGRYIYFVVYGREFKGLLKYILVFFILFSIKLVVV